MSTPLSLAEVERIATLAHLELTAEEKQLFTKQLADILAYADEVRGVDTAGVPATAHVEALRRAERDDEPRPSLPVAAAIDRAPEADASAGFFKVPRVIAG